MVKQFYRLKGDQANAREMEMVLDKYELTLTSFRKIVDILNYDFYYEDWNDVLDLWHITKAINARHALLIYVLTELWNTKLFW